MAEFCCWYLSKFFKRMSQFVTYTYLRFFSRDTVRKVSFKVYIFSTCILCPHQFCNKFQRVYKIMGGKFLC